jgi:hypothetical protein
MSIALTKSEAFAKRQCGDDRLLAGPSLEFDDAAAVG